MKETCGRAPRRREDVGLRTVFAEQSSFALTRTHTHSHTPVVVRSADSAEMTHDSTKRGTRAVVTHLGHCCHSFTWEG